jgi:alpha/beta superfamily hydrolase
MDNHVVMSLCLALAEGGLAALRFNFRGAGRSGGRHEGGNGEQEDVLAALAMAQSLPGADGQRLGLAGYSFGAVMAALAASRAKDLQAVALISPPVGAIGEDTLTGLAAPKLVLAGEMDVVASPRELEQWSQKLGESCELVVLPEVDHFWFQGVETAVARAVAFFRENLGPRE